VSATSRARIFHVLVDYAGPLIDAVLFPPSDALVEWLAHRKVFQFSDDSRLIEGVDLAREIDGMYDVASGVNEGPRATR